MNFLEIRALQTADKAWKALVEDKETFHFRPEIWNPSPNLRPRPGASVDEHFNVSVTEIQKYERIKESEKSQKSFKNDFQWCLGMRLSSRTCRRDDQDLSF